MKQIKCPRCNGKAYVDNEDIRRLGMELSWNPGTCRYCNGKAIVDEEIIKIVSVLDDPYHLKNDIDSDVSMNIDQDEDVVDEEIIKTVSVLDDPDHLENEVSSDTSMNIDQDESEQLTEEEIYNYAADLIINQKMSDSEVKVKLIEQGFEEKDALTVISSLKNEIIKEKKIGANKDMIYGALWCIGGTIATVSDTGYIWWGAIVFGGIQFFKGVITYARL